MGSVFFTGAGLTNVRSGTFSDAAVKKMADDEKKIFGWGLLYFAYERFYKRKNLPRC
jgi:hypothetical protein